MAAFVVNGALLGTWGSRVPAIIEWHGLSESSFSFLLLLMGLGALTAFQSVGRATDIMGAAKLTCIWAGALAVTAILIGLSPSVMTLGAAILCFGFAYAAMDVAMNSWATEVERQIGRSIIVFFHAMWSVGAGFGALGGYVAISLDLTVLSHFALASLTLAFVLVPALVAPWSSVPRLRRERYGILVLPQGMLILVSVIAVATTLGEGAMANWSAVYLHDVVGVGQSHAALGFAVYSAAMVMTRLVADRLVVGYGPVVVTRASGVCATIGVALVVGPTSVQATMLGFVLMGIGYAAIIPLAFSRAAADTSKSPGEAIAAVATFGHGAYLLGGPVIGLIAEATSLRAAFSLLGLCALVVAILAPVLRKEVR